MSADVYRGSTSNSSNLSALFWFRKGKPAAKYDNSYPVVVVWLHRVSIVVRMYWGVALGCRLHLGAT